MTFGSLGRWKLEGTIVLLGLCLVAEALFFDARAHALQRAESRRTDLDRLAERLDRQPHDCIPLGWYPAAMPAGGYYPDYNADIAEQTGVFQSGWVALVRPGERSAQAADVKNVLDELARTGLLERKALSDGTHYTLTDAGWNSFYERNDFGENVERWPFLCFSHLRVTSIAWSGPLARRRGSYYAFRRVHFTWTARTEAPWLTAFLRAHAVALPPVSNPAIVEARQYAGAPWKLASLSFEFGHIERRAAWAAGARPAR